MTGNTNKKLNIKGRSLLIPTEDDELYNLTDSENSSTSSVDQIFEKNQLLVMELHGMQRDELPDNPLPEVKTRKLLKKKRPRPDQEQSTGSLSSGSESSVVPPGPEKQEEFFDAHESYYDFPANQTSATAVRPPTVTSKPGNPEALRLAPPQNNPEDTDKRVPETTAPLEATAATVAAVTQETATGQTPLTSAKPIRPRNPE